jgi:hypothetical protein
MLLFVGTICYKSVEFNNLVVSYQQAVDNLSTRWEQCEHVLLTSCWTALLQVCCRFVTTCALCVPEQYKNDISTEGPPCKSFFTDFQTLQYFLHFSCSWIFYMFSQGILSSLSHNISLWSTGAWVVTSHVLTCLTTTGTRMEYIVQYITETTIFNLSVTVSMLDWDCSFMNF